jgi:ribonuclease BN (tRNA processing enzyme)
VKIQLLPSTFDGHGRAGPEQRLTCFLIDNRVTVDAGSIAIALDDTQRASVRDVIVTHPHIDHIASLPIFIDDLFAKLEEPIRVYATQEVVEALERDVFNWTVYPRFSELSNEKVRVMEYECVRPGVEFQAAHLRVTPVAVNHIVPTIGLIVTDGKATVAFSSDTSETEEFWTVVNRLPRLDALIIESSFPDELSELAEHSKHLTPSSLQRELRKFRHEGIDILAVHLKASYREKVIEELNALGIPKLRVMQPGQTYQW